MSHTTLIYPHQLFKTNPALKKGRQVFLIEEPLILTYNPIHRQKLFFHLKSLDYYEEYLKQKGYQVTRLEIKKYKTTEAIFSEIKTKGVTTIHVIDTTDNYLEKAIRNSRLERIWYESPQFILTKNEAIEEFQRAKKFMATFYKNVRLKKNILVANNAPTGGKWSFDEDNRKKVPKGVTVPNEINITPLTESEIERLNTIPAEAYGENGIWLPYTHKNAEQYLKIFLSERFQLFGDYEDAIIKDKIRLWHSTLSPLLNCGLLTPEQVMAEALAYAEINDIPINSLEGFVRQIIGWREFIRASYECEGSTMRNKNFFHHKKTLPKSFWDGSTQLPPFDCTIKKALSCGYNHHIERLMVMGNGLLLLGIHPNEVYRWFMGMYIDAYDWVMIPNVYGMSQFADGGSFATKPYISGANYLKKMSDYEKGDWENIWTALYWSFIDNYKEVFLQNHRMSMMPRLLAKMDNVKKQDYLDTAEQFKEKIFKK